MDLEVNTAHQASPFTTSLSNVLKGATTFSHAALSPFNSFRPLEGSILTSDSINGLALFAGENGQLSVYSELQGLNPHRMRTLTGHVGDINAAKFFPSGKVVLSGGADIALRIWDLETGLCAAQLKGHTRGVLDCDFIERGRNVVSASRDGTALLHDVPTQTIIARWTDSSANPQFPSPFNCIQVIPSHNGTAASVPLDQREVGTEDKLIAVGAENGQVMVFDVRTRNSVVSVRCSGAVNAVSATSSGMVTVAGDWSGLATIDLRQPESLLRSADYSAFGNVLRLKRRASGGDFVWASFSQGVACEFNASTLEAAKASLISDNEPINGISFYSEDSIIITASRNGISRVYNAKAFQS